MLVNPQVIVITKNFDFRGFNKIFSNLNIIKLQNLKQQFNKILFKIVYNDVNSIELNIISYLKSQRINEMASTVGYNRLIGIIHHLLSSEIIIDFSWCSTFQFFLIIKDLYG